MIKTLYCATGNAHKAEEIGDLLRRSGLQISVRSAESLGGMPEVEENGKTFAANAEIKARALLGKCPTEAAILSDDSGLAVDALNGAPGLFSARFAGPNASTEENNSLLLARLKSIPTGERTAQFICVLCLFIPEKDPLFFEGNCHGIITTSASGTKGFGYDPLFQPDGFTESFADLGDVVKHEISHRAKAIQALAQHLGKANG